MSTAQILQPAPAHSPARERHLRALPRIAPRRLPGLVPGVVALAGLVAIVIAQLGLSIALTDGAYREQALQSSSVELGREQQALREELAVLESPQSLALNAETLGMVQGQPSAFLPLSGASLPGGPDALHMQQPATSTTGELLVPNSLVQPEEAQTPAVAEEPAEPEPYPGMLLPVAGVATG